mmetsp:Transcript_24330/g.79396  ORF Transcript_24330/g.79396 Transcript_24330/m.79396 type:complete len:216 (+) Transcript_24330:395-1042(+)
MQERELAPSGLHPLLRLGQTRMRARPEPRTGALHCRHRSPTAFPALRARRHCPPPPVQPLQLGKPRPRGVLCAPQPPPPPSVGAALAAAVPARPRCSASSLPSPPHHPRQRCFRHEKSSSREGRSLRAHQSRRGGHCEKSGSSAGSRLGCKTSPPPPPPPLRAPPPQCQSRFPNPFCCARRERRCGALCAAAAGSKPSAAPRPGCAAPACAACTG